ncbi:hypothetical protein M942_16835 [Enterobacter ludwigii]|nr:hypothetical protein M942_16835 [Enterobacter ludwigii]
MRARTKVRAFFFYIPRTGGMRIPDRGSTTGDSQLDRLSAQRTGCPQGERRESIPPHRHIQDESAYESTGFFLLYSPDRGDENPRPGVDNRRQPVGQTERAANRLPAGRAKRVNPHLTAIFKIRARTKVRAFFFYILRPGSMKPCVV